MNGKGLIAIVSIMVVIILATLLNWAFISQVSTAIAGFQLHLLDKNQHLQKGIDGLPIIVTRTEFNALKELIVTQNKNQVRQNNLLIIMAVKQGIDVSEFIKKE